MNGLTSRQLKGLFAAIEINVLIWLLVCVMLWLSPGVERKVRHLATGGMIVASLLQHWAYYNLYRRARDQGQE